MLVHTHAGRAGSRGGGHPGVPGEPCESESRPHPSGAPGRVRQRRACVPVALVAEAVQPAVSSPLQTRLSTDEAPPQEGQGRGRAEQGVAGRVEGGTTAGRAGSGPGGVSLESN